MAAGAQARGWSGPSRRRVPRFQVQAPLDVTVLRSGIPDTVPGRSVNVCERGIAAMLAGEVVPGNRWGWRCSCRWWRIRCERGRWCGIRTSCGAGWSL